VTEVIERLQAKGMSEAVPFVSTVASMTGKVSITFLSSDRVLYGLIYLTNSQNRTLSSYMTFVLRFFIFDIDFFNIKYLCMNLFFSRID
jgi:hypothetical protein